MVKGRRRQYQVFPSNFQRQESKNFIPHHKLGEEIITDQSRMEHIFLEAYHNLIGTAHARNHTLYLDFLGMNMADLQDLDTIFTE